MKRPRFSTKEDFIGPLINVWPISSCLLGCRLGCPLRIGSSPPPFDPPSSPNDLDATPPSEPKLFIYPEAALENFTGVPKLLPGTPGQSKSITASSSKLPNPDLRVYYFAMSDRFGLGFERMVCYVGGFPHIREVVPYIRAYDTPI